MTEGYDNEDHLTFSKTCFFSHQFNFSDNYLHIFHANNQLYTFGAIKTSYYHYNDYIFDLTTNQLQLMAQQKLDKAAVISLLYFKKHDSVIIEAKDSMKQLKNEELIPIK